MKRKLARLSDGAAEDQKSDRGRAADRGEHARFQHAFAAVVEQQRTRRIVEPQHPEQQSEVENFKKKAIETRRDLKELRKNLRVESESLQFWTKVINIAVVPLLVVLLGVGLAMARRRRTVPK